jgi:hypothetical protein
MSHLLAFFCICICICVCIISLDLWSDLPALHCALRLPFFPRSTFPKVFSFFHVLPFFPFLLPCTKRFSHNSAEARAMPACSYPPLSRYLMSCILNTPASFFFFSGWRLNLLPPSTFLDSAASTQRVPPRTHIATPGP